MHSTSDKITIILGIEFPNDAEFYLIDRILRDNEHKFNVIGITLKDDIPAPGINLGINVIDLDAQLDAFVDKVKGIDTK